MVKWPKAPGLRVARLVAARGQAAERSLLLAPGARLHVVNVEILLLHHLLHLLLDNMFEMFLRDGTSARPATARRGTACRPGGRPGVGRRVEMGHDDGAELAVLASRVSRHWNGSSYSWWWRGTSSTTDQTCQEDRGRRSPQPPLARHRLWQPALASGRRRS